MKWFKMNVNAMRDIKFKKLVKRGKFSLPIYWTAFCIMLDVHATDGKIEYEDESDLEIIFEDMHFNLPDLAELLTEMMDVDLINWEDGVVLVKNWEKYQNVEYHSTGRVQKHRANKEHEDKIEEVIKRFNEMTGLNLSINTASHRTIISGRLNDGHSVETMLAVVAWKQKEWSKDERMKKYIRPSTLFNPGKFDNYLNEIPKDLMQAMVDGTLLKVRNIQGTIQNVTQEQYDNASPGFYDIIS